MRAAGQLVNGPITTALERGAIGVANFLLGTLDPQSLPKVCDSSGSIDPINVLPAWVQGTAGEILGSRTNSTVQQPTICVKAALLGWDADAREQIHRDGFPLSATLSIPQRP